LTTVIFVHGTGIREREYNETFQIIEQKIHAQRPDIKVAPCLWGVLGAKFNDNRASVPLEDATLALSQGEEDAEIVLWGQLYRDPLYELRLLSLKPIESGNPFGEEPGDVLQSRVASFTPTSQLQATLQEAGIAEVFEQAREAVIHSEPYERALLTVSESDLNEYYVPIARAVVAQAMFISEQQEEFPPILTEFPRCLLDKCQNLGGDYFEVAIMVYFLRYLENPSPNLSSPTREALNFHPSQLWKGVRDCFQTRRSPLTPLKKGGKETLKAPLFKGGWGDLQRLRCFKKGLKTRSSGLGHFPHNVRG
jgi:hypothetical protein